ncbi:hypothetical protein F511_03853 [Dorcoceras hygrometricum]|nr:hypothetical protein F511_03853 [Dorcoceras hygrometricum]
MLFAARFQARICLLCNEEYCPETKQSGPIFPGFHQIKGLNISTASNSWFAVAAAGEGVEVTY